MGLQNRLMHWGARLIVERPVKQKSLDDLSRVLQVSGQACLKHLEKTSDTAHGRRLLGHIVGIERWGQSRLRVALGEPFIEEEYNSHRPPDGRSWADLKTDFQQARQDTLALIQELKAHPLPENLVIRHNMFGPLTVRAWLRYLDMHARGEVKKFH